MLGERDEATRVIRRASEHVNEFSTEVSMTDSSPTSEPFGHRTVTDASILTFGGLTGDYAQMHFDHDFGPATGMGGTIAHGLLSGAWSLGALAQHAPARLALGDPGGFVAGYRVKFSRMVYIGDLFSLRWSEGGGPASTAWRDTIGSIPISRS
ncbi:MAG: hypothetical protein CL933_01375 [Deltaproteobacteria bacterium]|nr:hypothetical protein [Deltaproteobacteria bacterium]